MFELIKLLFTTKPSDIDELQLLAKKYLPPSGYKFMMWCGYIIYRKSKEDIINVYFETALGIKAKRHESFHLKRAQTAHSTWVGYYLNYVWEWLKGNPFWPPFNSAYYTSPHEMEAYALEDNQDALDNYDTTLFKSKYTIKNRKKTYKEHKDEWKTYVKSL